MMTVLNFRKPQEQPANPFQAGKERRKRNWIRGAGASIIGVLAKGKALLVILPKIKLLTTGSTMLVSVAAYSLFWGWPFAAGFVLLLLLHEMGHVIQLRREGVQASAPMFIPFMGAVIAAKTLGENALAEARVGLAGPVLGTLASAAVIPFYFLTHDNIFLALAFTGFFLNLFQLVPFPPLDGSRAMAALSPKMWIVGLVMIVGLAIVWQNPIIFIIILIGGFEAWHRWKARNTPASKEYYKIAGKHRVLVAAVYVGLIVVTVAGMAFTQVAQHTL